MGDDGKGFRKNAAGHNMLMIRFESVNADIFGKGTKDFSVITVGQDESPAATLCLAIVGGVDDPPLHCIALLVETAQDDGKVAAPLFGWGADQPIHILQ